MKILVLIIFCFSYGISYSQIGSDDKKNKDFFSLAGGYSYGTILPTNPFVEGANMNGEPMKRYQSFSLKALWQNPGYQDWQKVFKGPYYGLGITISDFFNREEVGHPVSYYGVLGIPLKRWKKLELYTELEFGIASNWTKYDSISNPYNLAIGGGLTVHSKLGLNAFYPISKQLDLGASLSFIHFSNGGFERPNRGFNIYSPSVELKYHFRERPNVRAIEPPTDLPKSNDLLFMLGYGDHQLVEHELDSNYFAIAGVSAIYFNQFSNSFRLGYGADFNYWWGLNAHPDGTPGPYSFDNITIGLILQPELIIDRVTLVGGIGIYANHLKFGSFKQTYQRLGVRYDFYKNFSIGMNVRAINFVLAEFLEFNLGYKIKWAK